MYIRRDFQGSIGDKKASLTCYPGLIWGRNIPACRPHKLGMHPHASDSLTKGELNPATSTENARANTGKFQKNTDK